MGLYLIIFDSNIHSSEVVVASTTPPQPSSRDHDVENSLAERSGMTVVLGPTTPSPVSSP